MFVSVLYRFITQGETFVRLWMFLCVREEGKSLVCVVLCDVVRLRVDNF